jgi:thiamine biosynthesis lipoprotein
MFSFNKIALYFLLLFIFSCNNDINNFKRIQGNALGTSYSIIVDTDIKEHLIKEKIDSIFEVINNSMSTYMDSSIISKVNLSDQPVVVDHHFIKVFNKSKEIWSLTEGSFDPTAGSFVNLYGLGPNTIYEKVDEFKIDSVKKIVGFDKVSLTNENEVIKNNKNIFIDFNAIAKGYSVDLIKELFEENLLENFLIEVGGELTSSGYAENNRRWKVAIQNPIDINSFHSEIFLTDKSLATSGNYRKFRIDPITGERYAHIINPLTGAALSNNILSASVISDNCIEADAWATSLMVMNPKYALDIINKMDGIEILLLTSKNNEIFEIKSNSWDLVTQ